MITIKLKNFGKFADTTLHLVAGSYTNGWGKTTLVNAYVFTLTGKTLAGFHVPRIGAEGETEVTLTFTDDINFRRVMKSGGTTLYINGDVTTQKTADERYSASFLALLANANALTADSLTSDELRKLLGSVDAIAVDESAELRKRLAEARANLRQAESYASYNVVLPAIATPPLNAAEQKFVEDYRQATERAQNAPEYTCDKCGSVMDESVYKMQYALYLQAVDNVASRCSEYERLMNQEDKRKNELDEVRFVERQRELSSQARADLHTLQKEVQDLQTLVSEADARAVRPTLPEGLEIVTEKTAKSGATSNVCTLTYQGVPLKSVNRSMRISLLVHLLADARKRRGLEAYPIIVDNAEAIDRALLADVQNVVRLEVAR